ncbi:hypothetical protein SCP_1101040 [Sparassis crispa]|uniref:Uncharacterized protein n=1 Tax=Sparassis crispa TaxID=139825 RepID=A0A401GZ38_9APHY|nr:hypothetical protein SCP_1101040 [Sparassis crispa]GBE87428.1 hypothetical protein SCP_1101040 [Sparassis crispa]
MVYLNFNTQITAKFGVVIENWPLPKFCCPGDVGSHTELEVLFGSWESGRMRFRSMPDEEWMQWLERRSQQVTTEAGNDQEDTVQDANTVQEADTVQTSSELAVHATPVDSPSNVILPPPTGQNMVAASSVTLPANDHSPETYANKRPQQADVTDGASQCKRAKTGAPFTDFVNVISAPDGSGLVVPKKTRKLHSDKGVKRGPRVKKKMAGVVENVSPSTTEDTVPSIMCG